MIKKLLVILILGMGLRLCAQPITKYEYWFDTDIGAKVTGSPQGNEVNLLLDVNDLSEGLHTLTFRAADDKGRWSAPLCQYFMKTGGMPEARLTRYEYWIDGNTSAKTSAPTADGLIRLDIDVNDLAEGLHTLTFRAADDKGRWSAPLCQYFMRPSKAFNDRRVMGYEYWFNEARDSATYVKLPEPERPLLLDVKLPVNNIEQVVTPDNMALVQTEGGKYKIGTRNLFHIRFKNTDSQWSTIQTDTFTTVVDAANLSLTAFVANPGASNEWTGWTVTGDKYRESTDHWSGESNPYFCLGSSGKSSWATTMEQTVSGLPAGTYILEAVGRATESATLELSAGDTHTTFPSAGMEGGEIWEVADEGSMEKSANGGKGFGWCRREITFTTDGNPFTIQVKASAEAKDQFAQLDDITLQVRSTTRLDVTFADTVDLAAYLNQKLVLSSAQSKQTLIVTGDSRTHSFRGLSSNATYSLSLQNRYGQEFLRMDGISLEEGDNTLTPEYIAKPATVCAEVYDASGRDVTDNVKVTWKDADGNYLAEGTPMTDIPEGCGMVAGIALDDSLGTLYQEVKALPVRAKAGNTTAKVTLQPLETVRVSGWVNCEDNPAAFATVSAVQLINGKYRKTASTTTGIDGHFEMSLINDSTELTASLNGYVDGKLRLGDFNTSTDLGLITLRPIRGKSLHVSFNYTRCATADSEAESTPWFSESANVEYVVKNRTKGIDLTEEVITQGTTLILPETTDAGDVIDVTAKSTTNLFADANSTATIAVEGDTEIAFDIIERGGIKAVFAESVNGGNRSLLYNENGRQVANAPYINGEAEYSHLAAGAYRLVSLGENRMLSSIGSLADLDLIGIAEGRDYAINTVTVSDGTISEVAVPLIPELNENAFYYITPNAQFTSNKNTVVTGNIVTATAQIELKEQYATVADDLSLAVDLPQGCAYVENSAIIGRTAAPYVLDGNRLVISLTKDNYRERIRFCLTPTQSGDYAPSALLSFDMGGETVTQSLGAAAFVAEDLGIELPSTTSKTLIPISGMALPYSGVTIYDGHSIIGHTQAKADGSWMVRCELHQAFNLSTHPIHAEICTPSDITLRTETKKVLYNMACNDVKSVTMINTAHGPSSLATCEYVTTFDFQNPTDEPAVYWYWPSYPTFTYKVEFDNDNPEVTNHVEVNVKTSSGQNKQLKPVFDAKTNSWIATSDFHSGDLPVNVGVSYDSPYEHSAKATQSAILGNLLSPSKVPTGITASAESAEGGYVTDLSCGENQYRLETSVTDIATLPDLTDYEAIKATDLENMFMRFMDKEGELSMIVPSQLYGSLVDLGKEVLDINEQTHPAMNWCADMASEHGYKMIVTKVSKMQDGELAVGIFELADNLIDFSEDAKEKYDMVKKMKQRIARLGSCDLLGVGESNLEDIDADLDALFERYFTIESLCTAMKCVDVEYPNPLCAVKFCGDLYAGCGQLGFMAKMATLGQRLMSYENFCRGQGQLYPLDERPSLCADAKFVMDPSGYVYEAVTSNRLEGVKATVYQKEVIEDMYGDKYEKVSRWDANAYRQKNPQLTDINGYYAWDVPQGLWQVKYEKDGYETVYSDWLPVPPPQLDINVGMSHAVVPVVKRMRGYESGVTVEMSKYMRPESFTPDCITVLRNGVKEHGELKPLNLEEAPYESREYVSKVKFVPEVSFQTTDQVIVTVHKGVESYCGVKMLADCTQQVAIEPEIREIAADSLIAVQYNGTTEMVVDVLPAEAASGKTLYVNASSPTIASTDRQEVTIGTDGKARFILSGNLPGCAALSFTMKEAELSAITRVQVNLPLKQVVAPKASVATGTLVENGTAVTLTTETEGATIVYTTDGSCPCEVAGRKVYDSPIVINGNTTIKAMAVKDGYDDSDVSTFVYHVIVDGVNRVDAPSPYTIKVDKQRILVEKAEGCTLSIYGADGKMVYRKERLKAHEAVSHLQPGNVYLVRLSGKSGHGTTERILIE